MIVAVIVLLSIPLKAALYTVFLPNSPYSITISFLIYFTCIYLFINYSNIVTVILKEDAIRLHTLLRRKATAYKYKDILRIRKKNQRVDVYYDSQSSDTYYEVETTIYFKDGTEFTMSDDTYSNVEEMIAYIESRRTL